MIAVSRIGVFAVLFAFLTAVAAWAQDETGPNYTEWRSVAVAVDQGLANPDISNDDLQLLRALLTDWRDQFLAASDTNAARISTVEAQIAALGPAPEDGAEPEPSEIAVRRSELNAQLAELQVPVRRAGEALSEANGLISEIDTEFRTRQAQNLLTRGPTPLDPRVWPQIITGIVAAVEDVFVEISTSIASQERRQIAIDRIPLFLFLAAVAVFLIGRGRRFVEANVRRLQSRDDRPGNFAASFLLSLLQVILPLLGIWALAGVLLASTLLGPRGNGLILIVTLVASTAFVGRWMAQKFFDSTGQSGVILDLQPQQKVEAQTYVVLLWMIFPVFLGVAGFAAAPDTDPLIIGLLSYPLVLISALFSLRLGKLLILSARADAMSDDDDEDIERARFLINLAAWIGRLLRLVAIAAPIAGAFGYMNLADALMLRTLAATVVVALLTLLHFVLQDVYALVSGKTRQQAADALAPVVLTLLLTLSSIPIFALILGARWSDIADFWVRARQGLTLGDLTISPTAIFVLLFVFGAGYFATRFAQSTLRSVILPKTKLDLGARTAVVSGVGYVGVTLAALVAVTTAGINLSSLAIVAGALSIGIGFGLRTIVENFVSGIILLVERPVSEGDWIEVGTNMGIVKDISVRATRVETFDRRDVIIPNADLVSGTVTNWTRTNNAGRIIVKVGVSYDSDSRQVEQILREIAEAHPLVVLNPAPAVFFRSFGDNALEFEVRCILRDINFMLGVESEISHEILRRFREERINIPFPQRDVWLRRPGDTDDVKGAQMTETFTAPTVGTGDAMPPMSEDFDGADGDGDGR
ncbi:MAG: mechanosensitive ion channel family protein [Rhodobacteraceae bacterium]|nr:mechanosensitive ion channel family protein [Paracoccaceae bacterium]